MEEATHGISVAQQHSIWALDYHAQMLSARRGIAPSSFYNVSTELRKGSLVPFQWEQVPGQRKLTSEEMGANSPPQAPRAAPQIENQVAHKPSMQDLFQLQNSSCAVLNHNLQVTSHVPCESSVPFDMEEATELETTSDTAFSIDTGSSDVITAGTAVLSTMEDTVPKSNMQGEVGGHHAGRELILHRFLPAAHAVACNSPHTPRCHHYHYPALNAEATQHLHNVTHAHAHDLDLDLDLDEYQQNISQLSNSTSIPPPTAKTIKGCANIPLSFRHAIMALIAHFSRGSARSSPSSKSHKQKQKKFLKEWQLRKSSSSASAGNTQKLSHMILQEDAEPNQNAVPISLAMQKKPMPTSLLLHQDESVENGARSPYKFCCCLSDTHALLPTSAYGEKDTTGYHYLGKQRTRLSTPDGKGFLGFPKYQYQSSPACMSATAHGNKLVAEIDAQYSGTDGSSQHGFPTSLVMSNGKLRFNSACCNQLQSLYSPSRFYRKPQLDTETPRMSFSSTDHTIQYGINAPLSPPLPGSPSESWLSKATAPKTPSPLSDRTPRARLISSPATNVRGRDDGPRGKGL